jgi:proline iminopeptidase
VLRGIFMLRTKELHWFYQFGASEIFPGQWRHFLAPIPSDQRGDLLSAYHRLLTCGDAEKQLEAARAWSLWEGATSSLAPNPQRESDFLTADFALPLARIEAHFFVNRGFFEHEEQLLRGIERIRHIPAIIVQGRYDVVCPMTSAWELAQMWGQADLRVVPDAGHSAYEPGITHELILATDSFLRKSTT